MRKIQDHEFFFTGELEPRRSVNLQSLIDEANELKKYVVAANVTDNPGSFVTMNSLAATTYVQEKTGIEGIFQLTCRDQNRLGLASSILAAAGVGIKNLLVLTGDHTTLGDMPQAKPVFDLDSAQLLALAREIVDQHSIYGNPLEDLDTHVPQMHIGIGANPNSPHPEIELLKIQRKLDLGAEFIQTQVIYDLEKTDLFFQSLKKKRIPVIVGLFPMRNYSTARDFDKYVAGVSVPSEILAQFKAVKQSNRSKPEKRKAYDRINVELLQPLIDELKKKGYATGIHITAVHYTRIFNQLHH